MARNHRSTSSSLALIILTSPKFPDGFNLGFVENLSINQSYNNEIIRGIGRGKGIENVPHGIVQCDVSWGQTHTYDQNAQRAGAIPENSDRQGLSEYDVLTVSFFNSDRGEFLAQAEGVLANQIGLTTGAQASVKENFSGSSIACRFHQELNP